MRSESATLVNCIAQLVRKKEALVLLINEECGHLHDKPQQSQPRIIYFKSPYIIVCSQKTIFFFKVDSKELMTHLDTSKRKNPATCCSSRTSVPVWTSNELFNRTTNCRCWLLDGWLYSYIVNHVSSSSAARWWLMLGTIQADNHRESHGEGMSAVRDWCVDISLNIHHVYKHNKIGTIPDHEWTTRKGLHRNQEFKTVH